MESQKPKIAMYVKRPFGDFKRSMQPDSKTGFPKQIVLIKEGLKGTYHDSVSK